MGDRWGPDGPPEEAYSRCTDPEVFRPLHRLAEEALDDLVRRYDVVREEVAGPERAVRLAPADTGAAPLTVVFTAFPGLLVRMGGEYDDVRLPECGCDACDETVPELREVLAECLAALVAGTFGERLVHEEGAWWHERWYVYAEDDRRGSSRTRLGGRDLEAALRALPAGERTWRPCPVRPATDVASAPS